MGISSLRSWPSTAMIIFLLLPSLTLAQPSPSFCSSPPVVSNLSLSAYSGRWYQTYTSGSVLRSFRTCITANYTVLPLHKLRVLNCGILPNETRVSCVTGIAERRPNGTTAQLQVSFGGPPGEYNVAALVGDEAYGYFAAVVYFCRDGRETFFFLARSPFLKEASLALSIQQLTNRGYVLRNGLQLSPGVADCKYFDSGFDVVPAEPFNPNERFEVGNLATLGL